MKKLSGLARIRELDIFSGTSGIVLVTIVVISVCLYVSFLSTSAHINDGDQFISAAIYGDIGRGTPLVSSEHTNLIKFPILWLQGQLPQTLATYAIPNALLVAASFLLWAWLGRRIFGEKSFAFVSLMLSAILIASPVAAADLMMSTIRHIEYSLMLWSALMFTDLLLEKDFRVSSFRYIIWISITALLVLNDRVFLYTYIPVLIITLLIALKKREYSISKKIVGLFLGVLAAIGASYVALVALRLTHLVSMSAGYSSITSTISIDQLIPSVVASISHILDLFAGNLFSMAVLKQNVYRLIGFMVVVAGIAGICQFRRSRLNEFQNHMLYILLGFMGFTVLFYIFTGSALRGSSRYLVGILYVIPSFAIYFLLKETQKLSYDTLLITLAVIALPLLSLPRVLSEYSHTTGPVVGDSIRTERTAQILMREGVDTVIAGGGHYSLWYESDRHIVVTQLEGSCSIPSSWANNTYWTKPSGEKKTAFLVDQTYPEPASLKCGKAEVENIYGKPSEVIPVSKPNETRDRATTFLYIYPYDIRSRLAR